MALYCVIPNLVGPPVSTTYPPSLVFPPSNSHIISSAFPKSPVILPNVPVLVVAVALAALTPMLDIAAGAAVLFPFVVSDPFLLEAAFINDLGLHALPFVSDPYPIARLKDRCDPSPRPPPILLVDNLVAIAPNTANPVNPLNLASVGATVSQSSFIGSP